MRVLIALASLRLTAAQTTYTCSDDSQCDLYGLSSFSDDVNALCYYSFFGPGRYSSIVLQLVVPELDEICVSDNGWDMDAWETTGWCDCRYTDSSGNVRVYDPCYTYDEYGYTVNLGTCYPRTAEIDDACYKDEGCLTNSCDTSTGRCASNAPADKDYYGWYDVEELAAVGGYACNPLWFQCEDELSPDATIECDVPVGGYIDEGESIIFAFNNTDANYTLFSTCGSTMDTQLYLLDESGNEIQSQATNGCDGDDCEDSDYNGDFECGSLTETFTIYLDVGVYYVKLQPFDGGEYVVTAQCSAADAEKRIGMSLFGLFIISFLYQ